MKKQEQVMLSKDAKAEIDRWVAKYPKEQKRSAVLAALDFVQKENGGHLDKPLMQAVANYLEIPDIAVYEVATFYSMFNLAPVGKHVINVCTNVSCMLRHSDKIVKHLEKRLDAKLGETTKDNKFTLREVECLAACSGAPMMQIGAEYHENLTPEKVDEILAGLN